jgi:S1-C subfamily serine protease
MVPMVKDALLRFVVAATVVLGACTGAPPTAAPQRTTTPTVSPPALPSPNTTVGDGGDAIVSVVERTAPAVVNVTSSTLAADAFGGTQPGEGVGTGFVVRGDGVIVTNFHVVESAVDIEVILPPPDRRSFTARVIGADAEKDIAVLKVDATELPTVPLGKSSDLLLGEPVIALGYALALPGGPTVTSGIISSLERTVEIQDQAQGTTRTLEGILQTDAAINPGNSGGPLVDLAGNVIGINTAGANLAENIGFAIAIDAARPIIDQAMADPDAPVAYLGVQTTTVDAGVAAQFDLPVDAGALVVGLAPDGPAEDAGIVEGEVIVAFGGQDVGTSEELGTAIRSREPGDRVEVEVVEASGTRRTVTVTLVVRPLP